MSDLWGKVSDWLAGPCVSCEESSSRRDSEHVAMPVSRPQYVDSYLEGLVGPNEQHEANPEGHCVNPKCRYTFTPQDIEQINENHGEFTCPQCGYTYDYFGAEKNPTYGLDYDTQDELGITNLRPANPGGYTRSGLTLTEMGAIGEQIVARMGELPGVGVITWVNQNYGSNGLEPGEPDCIVTSQNGKFGCEIKTNHSQAQERFKVGGKSERMVKMRYDLQNGLKPALIGVRLNFYTDKALIFFREGLHDTWVGNSKMLHVATLDFSDLNPFKSPDPQAQALAVENANLPDQSEEEEFNQIFGQTA